MNIITNKKASSAIICLFFPLLFFAQKGTVELGGYAGFAQYQGDMAENHIEFGETLISKGLYFRVHVNEYFSLKTGYYNGTISGDDKNAGEESFKKRQWRFDSEINEFFLLGEWNILGVHRMNKWRKFKPNFTPFLFTGVAAAKARTALFIPEKDAHLFPENGDKDSFFVLPIGLGLRLDISPHAAIGAEIGWRSVFSDYLDDVSLNGRRDKNDWYSFGGINVSILLGQWFFD